MNTNDNTTPFARAGRRERWPRRLGRWVVGRITAGAHGAAATPERAFRYVAAYTVFLGAATALTIGCGAAGIRMTQPVALAIVALSVVAGVLQWRLLRSAADVGPVEEERSRDGAVMVAAAVVFAALVFGVIAFEAWIKPDFSWRGLLFHAPRIHFWGVEGRIHWITPQTGGTEGLEYWMRTLPDYYWNGSPSGVETLAFLFVNVFGTAKAINAVNLLFAPLGALSVLALSRLAGARPLFSALAAALFVLLPVTVQQSFTTMTDAGFGAAMTAWLCGLVYLLGGWVAASRRSIPVTGAALGLVIGTSVWGLLAALTTAVLVGAFLLGRRFGPARSGPRTDWRNSALFCAGIVLIAACVGGYWSIRNAYYMGSPFWPLAWSSEDGLGPRFEDPGEILPPMRDDVESRPVYRLWRNTGVGFGASAFDWPENMKHYKPREGGLGTLWVAGCVPALAALLGWTAYGVRSRRGEGIGGGVTVLLALCLVVAVSLVMPVTWVMRFAIYVHTAGLPALAWAADRAWRLGRWSPAGWTSRAWVIAAVGVAVVEAGYNTAWFSAMSYASSQRSPDVPWIDFNRDPHLAARTFWWHDPAGYLYPHLSLTLYEEALRGNAPVALGPFAENPITRLIVGQLSQHEMRRPILFLSEATASEPEALAAFIRDHGARYVFWNYFDVPPKALEDAADRADLIVNTLRIFAFE